MSAATVTSRDLLSSATSSAGRRFVFLPDPVLSLAGTGFPYLLSSVQIWHVHSARQQLHSLQLAHAGQNLLPAPL